MKTTIDIADDLIERARLVQKRDDVTLRSLIEEGLRLVLDRRVKPARLVEFDLPVFGEPWKQGMEQVDVSALIAETNAERDDKPFGIAAAMVAEKAAGYRATRPPAGRRKPG